MYIFEAEKEGAYILDISSIDKNVIVQLREGSEKAFSKLFKAYYSYLNTVALCYLLDKEAGAEVVDDVFVNIWNKRETLSYPIHYYLVRSVKNACTNYIRAQRARQNVMDKHKEQILAFQESYIQSTPVPLQYVEMRQAEDEIRVAINNLPLKCKAVFEEYFYGCKSVDDIAANHSLTVSTVRVHIKNATDRLRQALKHLLILAICAPVSFISLFEHCSSTDKAVLNMLWEEENISLIVSDLRMDIKSLNTNNLLLSL
ncbi:MAG: RNA polymerase sigma-70 factor [Bacteroidales bacterium]